MFSIYNPDHVYVDFRDEFTSRIHLFLLEKKKDLLRFLLVRAGDVIDSVTTDRHVTHEAYLYTVYPTAYYGMVNYICI